MMSGGNGTERQSMDITSAIGSLTELDWETAVEDTSVVSIASTDTETADVERG